MATTTHDARSYWDRRLERAWSLRGVGLAGVSHAYNTWLYRVRSRVFHRLVGVLDIEPSSAKVLDVGVGVGFYTRRWLALGAEVVGVDIADSAVRRLRARFPTARFERVDIADDVSLLGDGFDIVWRQPAFVLMNYPFDSHRWHRTLWHKVLAPLQRQEATGAIVGALLYWPEVALTRLLRESPTTELVLCRKPRTARPGR